MPSQFEASNQIAASRAIDIVYVQNREKDLDSVEEGAKVVSEAFYRTLAKLGIELPQDFSDALTMEFDDILREESHELTARLRTERQG